MTELLLHPKISDRLSNIFANPPHALLVTGPSGSGKSTLIRHVATNLLDKQDLSKHPYVRYVDAGEGDGIAHVRDIRTFLNLKTTGNNKIRRIVILENVDKLGFDAQNAVLKTIEEPPIDTVILLTASSIGPVADTILSRVSQLQILPLGKQVSAKISGYTAEEFNKAHALSGGYAGSLISLLDSDDSHYIKKSVSAAKEYLSKTTYERLCSVDSISKDKQEIVQLLEGLERCLVAAIRATSSKNVASLITKLDYVDKAQLSLKRNVNSKLLLTALAANL